MAVETGTGPAEVRIHSISRRDKPIPGRVTTFFPGKPGGSLKEEWGAALYLCG